MHSHDYRDHRGYEGKRVVVIGVGNSGGDIAVELGKFGSQVGVIELNIFLIPEQFTVKSQEPLFPAFARWAGHGIPLLRMKIPS